MTKPKTAAPTFEPAPVWGIHTQQQLDDVIDWVFREVLQEETPRAGAK